MLSQLCIPTENTEFEICVSSSQLGSQRLKVQSDRIIAQNQLRKKMGQLMYLRNLAKVSSPSHG